MSIQTRSTTWKQIKHSQEEVKVNPQKACRMLPWRLQGHQVKNIPIETQQKCKQIVSRALVITLGSHSVTEANSIVVHVSNSMNEVKMTMKTAKTVKMGQQQRERMMRFQERTRKSEDSSNQGEVHPRKRNNE